MQHDVDAVFQRPLIVGGRKSRVNESFHTVALADIRKALEIDDTIIRICRRFADKQSRYRANRFFDRLVVSRWHNRYFDTIPVQYLSKKLSRSPVRIVGHDDMRIMGEHRV